MIRRSKITIKVPEAKLGNTVSTIRKSHFSKPINSAINHILFLQRTIGNKAVQGLFGSGIIKTKLTIGQPGDKYEQEADRVADAVIRMPEPRAQRQAEKEEELEEEEVIQQKPLSEQITPLVQREVELEEEEKGEEEILQTKEASGQTPEVTPNLESRIRSLRGRGQPLPKSVLNFFKPRFGYDFSQVQIHTDSNAIQLNKDLNAQAFTHGRDIYFGAWRYNPNTSSGEKLLAHELTHVVQQEFNEVLFQRQATEQKKEESIRTAKPKIDYAKAEKKNKYWASKLGWDERLTDIQPFWIILWSIIEKFDEFADEMAAFQVEQGFKGKQIDGVLGPNTWDRLLPIGEVIARQKRVRWVESEKFCHMATKERLTMGYKRATGKELIPKEEKGEKSKFHVILKNWAEKFDELNIPEEFRGTGAAGALVYLKKGVFVSQSDIWDNKALKPGAVVQIWYSRSDFERVKRGQPPSSFVAGHSFVFLNYVGNDAMMVLEYGRPPQKISKNNYVWIGANLLPREPEGIGAEKVE